MDSMEPLTINDSVEFPAAKILEFQQGKALVMYEVKNDMWRGLASYDGWTVPLEALSFNSICLEFKIFIQEKILQKRTLNDDIQGGEK